MRAKDLKSSGRNVDSSITTRQQNQLFFPQDDTCWPIGHVNIIADNEKFPISFLQKLAQQATGQCLGVKGIQLLGKALQNEIINRGYITTYINVPKQTISRGVLTYEVATGRVGHISLTPQSQQYISQVNNLPFSTGNILNLRDMEQGAENLQRIPGSLAAMRIYPGKDPGTSDIYITRQQNSGLQTSLWLNDAGSRYTGRYQSGGVVYLYHPSSLNDIFYLSGCRNLAFSHARGSQNYSIGYSVPWNYWTFSLFGNRSQHQQPLSDSWGQLPFIGEHRYLSAGLSRVLSHTREQKTSAALSVFKGTSRYYLDDIELGVMHKQNPGWKFSVQHQRNFSQATMLTTLGYQDRLNLFASTPTPEEQAKRVSSHARMLTLDIQALMKFGLTGPRFSYAPLFNLQLSEDELTQQNRLALGNRWTVHGFDGENNLTQNQGWSLSNNFLWDIPLTEQQLYSGLNSCSE